MDNTEEQKSRADQDNAVGPPVPWPDALQRVLTHLRNYSAASVVDAVMLVLASDSADQVETLRKFPWLLLLIGKWALQDTAPLRVGPRMPPEHLNELRNLIWGGGGQAHLDRKDRLGEVNVLLMMRQILYCQMPFQSEDISGLFRSSGLIARLPKDHACRKQYIEVMGMEPLDFVMLGIVLVGAARAGATAPMDMSMFVQLVPAFGPQIRTFLDMLAPSLPDLRNRVRSLPPVKGTRSRELYEFTAFKRYPLLRRRDGSFSMWHPSVVDRCADEIVHLRLAQFGEKYTQPFSRIFESYVVELARGTGLAATPEEAYWARYGKKVKAVDVILGTGADRVLIEAKMGLFHEDVLLQETEKGVRDQTPHLLRALNQGYAVSHQLASDAGDADALGVHYLIVVTSRDLLVGSGLMLAELCGPKSADPSAEHGRQRLPLNHVFVMSVLEYERLMEAVAAGSIDLLGVLGEAATACQTLNGSRYHFHEYYQAKLAKCPTPRLIDTIKNEAVASMAAALGVVMPEDQPAAAQQPA